MADLTEKMAEQTLNEPENKSLAEKSGYYYAHSSVSADAKQLHGAQTIYNHKPLNQAEVSEPKKEESWDVGRWEQKDFGKAAESLIKRELKGKPTPNNLATFTLCFKVAECQCGVTNSRGQKKIYLEIDQLECSWEANDGKGKGKVEVTELTHSVAADKIRIKPVFRTDRGQEPLSKEEREPLEAELKACGALMKEVIDKVLAELSAGNLAPNKPEQVY